MMWRKLPRAIWPAPELALDASKALATSTWTALARGGRLSALIVLMAIAPSAVTAQAPKGPPPPSVIVDVARERDVSEQQSYTGRIEAIDKVAIRARISGFLKSRGFEEGAEVAKDHVLFEIEKEPFEAALALAEANLANAQAALILAQATFDRATPLAERGTASQATLDDARAKLSQAQANIKAQEANVVKARIDLSYTIIRAPMTGATGRAAYALGEYVSPMSNPLVTLVRQDPMYVAFPIPQRDLLRVRREGRNADSVLVRLRLPDGSTYTHDGTIRFAEVVGNPGTDTVTIRAQVPNPERLLVDQQIVGVTVVAKKPERKLVVSQAALMLDQKGASVLVVTKEHKIENRRVEVGEQLGPDIVISKGLAAGDEVVIDGHQKVRPGVVVNPHRTTDKPAAATR
ncbi:MAG: efflux RND transporter periplasmic adaptor subunit [Hyphomicrobiaceae bacterium]